MPIAYYEQSLVIALDHSSNIRFSLFILIRPVPKIAARSLSIENETITILNVLTNLNTKTSIATTPLIARPQKQKQSFYERLIHFFIIEFPLVILIGSLSGILHLIKIISNDLMVVFTIGTRLYSMYQKDMKFYQGNIPIDSVIYDGLSFYTRRLVHKKVKNIFISYQVNYQSY
ncbi:unnamed protein product [Rotaria sordida]|uniref:Uncharacterized protein n=1 Tax=Rotaria sordida TaxID=392033 RepID=A0A814ESE3_9BILA|nr:unnamed protein product [Rotaria sordida]CAF1461051.1 unnamed protein product [Rotaria sordida]